MRSPGRQQYYDPFIEGEETEVETQLQLRAIAVQEPGTYILFEDMLDAIRSFAFSVDTFAKQQGIHELIMWLEGTGAIFAEDMPEEQMKGIKVDNAERIELYPDANKKWHARLIGINGEILGKVNDGSFDRDWVEQDIALKYPNIEIWQMEAEDEDSTWKGKGPSPRLWQRPQD